MRVLITGGMGMLGSAVARRFLKEGYRVVLMDSNPDPFFLHGRGISEKNVEIEIGDIRNGGILADILKRHGIDLVLHFAAALSSTCNRDPALATEINCLATVRLLDECRNLGIRRVIMSSAMAVYGSQKCYPEESFPLREDALLQFFPGSPIYGAGKVYMEAAAHWYRAAYDMEIAGMRLAFVASAGRPSRPPLGAIGGEIVDAPAIGRPVTVPGGNSVLNYVYVEDVVEQFFRLSNAEPEQLAAGPFFNTGGMTCTVGDIIDTIRGFIPDAEIEVDEGSAHITLEMPTRVSDQTFAETYGYSRQYDLESSVAAQIDEARHWPGLKH